MLINEYMMVFSFNRSHAVKMFVLNQDQEYYAKMSAIVLMGPLAVEIDGNNDFIKLLQAELVEYNTFPDIELCNNIQDYSPTGQ